jgi:hypothetical protein
VAVLLSALIHAIYLVFSNVMAVAVYRALGGLPAVDRAELAEVFR